MHDFVSGNEIQGQCTARRSGAIRWGTILVFLLACCLVVLAAGHEHLAAFAHARGPANLKVLLLLLLVIPANILALTACYLIELVIVGWRASSLRLLSKRDASVRLDILSTLVMVLIPHRILDYILSFGMLYALDVYAAPLVHISLTRDIPTWGLQILCLLLFQSFLRYWLHRLEHAIPLLWSIHKFHHSADRLTMLTSARNTSFIKGIENGLLFLPLALVTNPVAPLPRPGNPAFSFVLVYFAYHCFTLTNGYLAHSNIASGYGWFGRWLFASPAMHRLHHAKDPLYHNKNFTFDFVMWDRMFGTYIKCEPGFNQCIEIGLDDDNPFNNDASLKGVAYDYFVTSWVVFFKKLAGRRDPA